VLADVMDLVHKTAKSISGDGYEAVFSRWISPQQQLNPYERNNTQR